MDQERTIQRNATTWIGRQVQRNATTCRKLSEIPLAMILFIWFQINLGLIWKKGLASCSILQQNSNRLLLPPSINSWVSPEACRPSNKSFSLEWWPLKLVWGQSVTEDNFDLEMLLSIMADLDIFSNERSPGIQTCRCACLCSIWSLSPDGFLRNPKLKICKKNIRIVSTFDLFFYQWLHNELVLFDCQSSHRHRDCIAGNRLTFVP